MASSQVDLTSSLSSSVDIRMGISVRGAVVMRRKEEIRDVTLVAQDSARKQKGQGTH